MIDSGLNVYKYEQTLFGAGDYKVGKIIKIFSKFIRQFIRQCLFLPIF